jgi:hypothetical protein
VYLNADAFCIFEDDLVKLATVTVEHWACLVAWRVLLIDNNLACVVFVDIEAVVAQIDGDLAHGSRYSTIVPAVEDSTCVRAKGYDIAENLERGKGLVDHRCVSLSNAFYGCCETTKAYEQK